MKIMSVIASAVFALGLAATAPSASTVDFEVGGSTSASISSQTCGGFTRGCGISASAAGAVGESFTLAEGESATFDFIDFSVNGRGIFAGTYVVDAILDFLNPGGSTSAQGSGGFAAILNLGAGVLDWTGEVSTAIIDGGVFAVFAPIVLADGTQYTVALEEGVAIGAGRTATARANVRLDIAPVPLPASAVLLLVGIGGLGAVRMRRKAA